MSLRSFKKENKIKNVKNHILNRKRYPHNLAVKHVKQSWNAFLSLTLTLAWSTIHKEAAALLAFVTANLTSFEFIDGIHELDELDDEDGATWRVPIIICNNEWMEEKCFEITFCAVSSRYRILKTFPTSNPILNGELTIYVGIPTNSIAWAIACTKHKENPTRQSQKYYERSYVVSLRCMHL